MDDVRDATRRTSRCGDLYTQGGMWTDIVVETRCVGKGATLAEAIWYSNIGYEVEEKDETV
jgi:hypothetical protein